MDTSAYNTKAFTDAIKKMAFSKCKKIDEETSELREQRLLAIENDAEKRYKGYIDYETERIRNDMNCKISKLYEAAKKQLTDQRNALADKVFDEVLIKIREFCASDNYKDYLIKLAKEIIFEFPDGELEFFLRENDMKYAQALSQELTADYKITQSKDIEIGGIKAVDHKTDCLADNTLDSKLNTQKNWFFEQSGLKI